MTGATPPTFQLGLTGYPLGHSLSPRLHQAALTRAGLSGSYRRYPVRPLPEGAAALQALLARLRAGTLHGLNVTIPHKEQVIPWLDALTAPAAAIGAVNTIWYAGGRLWGDNTDAPGFLADAGRFLGPAFGRRPVALVLGAGGSARAVTYGLGQAGWEVTVAARRLTQARQLVADLSASVASALRATALAPGMVAAAGRPGLVVNTTPVGMAPQTTVSPWPAGEPFPAGAGLYDLIYNPEETALVRLARAAGLRATTGLGMLLEQAALAFTRWTKVTLDFRVVAVELEMMHGE